MAININDTVYLPRDILGLDPNNASPFFQTTVREKQGKSVRVDHPDGSLSDFIGTKRIWKNFGILIIRIGDFQEDYLLEPLAKSILNYSRMLLPPDAVRLVELRTVLEFSKLWEKFHGMCQQVVIVGHGSKKGIFFGDDEIAAADFIKLFEAPNPQPKELVSLACNTGYAGFGQLVSNSKKISHCIAPFHQVHGCVGSLFAATYLHERMLAFQSPKIAFKHARKDLVGATSFRLWENGKLTAGPI
ncbi:hypothetical protein [Poseidonocella sp. HB161398]|uniref:hypothetical protein n=1 Tax=Poseidonocella sp. HB161398 TaxID=2320855 RepID=UPI0011095CC4|nr:hypothetical protein [Poseidonocella sp. HB161398]